MKNKTKKGSKKEIEKEKGDRFILKSHADIPAHAGEIYSSAELLVRHPIKGWLEIYESLA